MRDERVNHQWYYLLKKIEIVKYDLRFSRGKKKQRLEVELKILEADRKDFLIMTGVDEPPEILKIEIIHK